MPTAWARDTLARTFSSLRIRNYRFYFAGQGISMIGTWMQSVTQSWLVYTLTHSGFQVGLVVALQALPILFFGPVGGTLADRFGKYRMLFWTQSLAGVQALSLAVLDLSGHLQLWHLYLIATSLGFIKMVDNPTRQSFISEMVGREQVRNAVTLNIISNNVARAVGPAVAGLLIAAVGSGWCFLINACSFVFVIGGLIGIRQDQLTPAARATRMRGQLSEGFRYVRHQPVLRDTLLLMAVVGCLTYEFQTTLPLMAGDAFGGTSATYGFLTGFMGLGSVLGGLVAAGRRDRGPDSLYVIVLAFGAVVLLAALAPTELVEDLALILVGAGSVTFTSLTNSTLQLNSSSRMRGRVMSLWSVGFQGTTPIGGPLVGFIAGEFGARFGLGVGAVAAVLAGAVGLATFRRRQARGGASAGGPAAGEPAADAPAATAGNPPAARLPAAAPSGGQHGSRQARMLTNHLLPSRPHYLKCLKVSLSLGKCAGGLPPPPGSARRSVAGQMIRYVWKPARGKRRTGACAAAVLAAAAVLGPVAMSASPASATAATTRISQQASHRAGPPTGGSLGPNVYVFTPAMSQSSIQSTLNAIYAQQATSQFGPQRYALLFEPGTYGSAASPLVFSVGFYEEVAGLGRNPGDVTINGAINSFNQCSGGSCTALTNFWRSVSNLTINVMGNTGCYSGRDFWAVSQAAPMRRVHVNGGLTLMDYCTGSPDYASGGFIADSQFSGGTIINGSQQQYMTRNSDIDGWSNSVWNQVFCGDPGAPAQSFASNSGDPGGPSSYTTLSTCPVTEEAPYLYTGPSGGLQVFVPAVQRNSSGPTWVNGNTPGTSLPLDRFYVASPSSSVATINAALAAGDNLLFTPGVYHLPSTIWVTRPDTKIIGLGFPTLIPTRGNVTMHVGDVGGVNMSGMIFDAGPYRSPVLLDLGLPGARASHASDPASVSDVFFRVGGAEAGTAAVSFADNSSNSIIDDVWAWRADHGAGAGSWTSDQGDTGLVVTADNVTAYGLAVEHYQKQEVVWAGQGGEVIFFQNENPYEVPSQAAWMETPSHPGYPAFYLPASVRTFQGYGLGSYSYFDQGADIHNAMAFQAPGAPGSPGVQFHDLLTMFLNGSGGIDSVINGTGAAVNASFHGPSDLVTYP